MPTIICKFCEDVLDGNSITARWNATINHEVEMHPEAIRDMLNMTTNKYKLINMR